MNIWYYVVLTYATIALSVDSNGFITEAPPIVRNSNDEHIFEFLDAHSYGETLLGYKKLITI